MGGTFGGLIYGRIRSNIYACRSLFRNHRDFGCKKGTQKIKLSFALYFRSTCGSYSCVSYCCDNFCVFCKIKKKKPSAKAEGNFYILFNNSVAATNGGIDFFFCFKLFDCFGNSVFIFTESS